MDIEPNNHLEPHDDPIANEHWYSDPNIDLHMVEDDYANTHDYPYSNMDFIADNLFYQNLDTNLVGDIDADLNPYGHNNAYGDINPYSHLDADHHIDPNPNLHPDPYINVHYYSYKNANQNPDLNRDDDPTLRDQLGGLAIGGKNHLWNKPS